MTTGTFTSTQRLGQYLAQAATRPLRNDVATKAAICLIDALGLAVVAREETTAKAARRVILPTSQGVSSIWADGTRASPADAAFANGIAVHAHFQDDTDHVSWSHPGSLVPPVAIALVEASGGSVAQALRALVAGYAVMNWLGVDEIVSRRLIARGMRTSPTFGTIGAAAAGAAALGLGADEAASAVAIAASTTGGTLEPVRCGSDEWRIQNGRAAQGGLLAALMAQQGVVGAPDALCGRRGFLMALAGMDAPPDAWKTDPDPSIMLQIMAKPFATLGDNMPAVMAARAARAHGIEPARICSIRVTLWRPYSEYPGTAFKGPFERIVQTQASTAFAVAAMLIHGDLTYEMGTTGRSDPLLNALVAKTTIVPDDERGALDSTVTVTLKDGSIVTADAKEAPETLLFQNEARAVEVFRERFSRAGLQADAAGDLAARILGAAAGERPMPVADIFDAIRAALQTEGRRAHA
ncbi:MULTISPECIES: MmgE/PrpD family protein [unclassified Chelatococcus]|uniref:MmgE/PrpD family protein n=1 Tax=unclassified Chelatococcus TaxID=2638111 RepID=UPI001BCE7082|nr:MULTISPECIES: MmgE/PrpD family protein [unclassified Chelatococcus]MBS7701358.1 MmgE/PrpD family protein [Chelatococcus sp. YT9]MBX3557438.1 MmgE/PrpD family protein [Chelatococcus sp.]